MTASWATSTEDLATERLTKDDFTAFYACHFPQLMGSLVLYTGDREVAMELAQETMARAFQHWSKVAGMEAPPAWLHRVGFNLANSLFRRKLIETRAAAGRRAAEVVDDHDARTASSVMVREMVARLPKRQKTALVLRYYADMSVSDVAQVMGCAEGTVRALTSQALTSLRSSGVQMEEER